MSGGMTVSLGRWAVARHKAFGQLCAFLGETFVEGLGMLLRPRRFRFGDAALAFERACTDGLPITILIGLLLGLILAFESAATLQRFGAEVYVADMITIALFR